MQRIEILGVPIDVITQSDALLRIAGFLKSAGQFHIATPNPEMLVEAHRNSEFKKVLQGTALNLPDGAGVVWAIKRRSRCLEVKKSRSNENTSLPSRPLCPLDLHIERVTGTDILQDICSSSSRLCPPERVFLLGAAPGIAEKAGDILKERNPSLVISGTHCGSPKPEDEEEIITRINSSQPTLLFVAFGAPAQDFWIARNLSKLSTVKIAMGIGGAFDFIVGKQKRAPRFMRRIGLEWLWRLILQPSRIRRIWRAVVIFSWLTLTYKPE